jgi:hypothetical protein
VADLRGLSVPIRRIRNNPLGIPVSFPLAPFSATPLALCRPPYLSYQNKSDSGFVFIALTTKIAIHKAILKF